MTHIIKKILLVLLSFLLLTTILVLGVLWTFSSNIPDYKFLKKLNSMTKTVFSELSITEINKIINKNPSLLNINKSRHLRNNYVNSQ